MSDDSRFLEFTRALDDLVSADRPEHVVVAGVRAAMARLVERDDWLPEFATRADPSRYQQYLLHRDPAARYSVVSFVWGPGQRTPIHDHTVWGVIGMLRGGERSEAFRRDDGRLAPDGAPVELRPGDVEIVSPATGDIHRVSNAFDDRVSISIHAYGADIGTVRRHIFDPSTGASREFVSGYTAR